MLEFKKRVLLSVSFDLRLFEKELNKALSWLEAAELKKLIVWCYEKFSDVHKNVMDRVFQPLSVTSA
jgi:hypothetical protein